MKATGLTCFILMLSSSLVANAVRTLKGGTCTIVLVGLDMALSASCGYSVDRFGVTFVRPAYGCCCKWGACLPQLCLPAYVMYN